MPLGGLSRFLVVKIDVDVGNIGVHVGKFDVHVGIINLHVVIAEKA
jgi:hypothetical protein